MAYELQAVIAGLDLLVRAAAHEPRMHVVMLPQRLALMPMSDQLFDLLNVRGASQLGFVNLPGGFDATIAAWSQDGPVAYVEADYFGGVGDQQVAVWDHGNLVLGPVNSDDPEHVAAAGTPISQALRRLGASTAGRADEFDAMDLGRHRRTEKWLEDPSVQLNGPQG